MEDKSKELNLNELEKVIGGEGVIVLETSYYCPYCDHPLYIRADHYTGNDNLYICWNCDFESNTPD
jgi:predicted RNA-binding Zn-ribbon protein involved in translation (DUF1610 family)